MKLPNKYHDRRMETDDILRRTQLVELHLLEVVKRICDDHGLRLWLAHGTLIGAMRHGGFVPWDDDLDIWMTYDDFAKFQRYAKDELPDDVFIELPECSPRAENSLVRVRDNYSTVLQKHSKRLLINDHHGIFIEIFLLRECASRCALTTWVLHSFETNRGWWRRAHFDEVTVWNLLRKWAMGLWVFAMRCVWEALQAVGWGPRYMIQFNFYTAWKWWMPRDWFFREGQNPRTVPFEGLEMPVPYEAESFLEMQYGDWRQLPPPERRKGLFQIVLPDTPCFHPAARKWTCEDEAR